MTTSANRSHTRRTRRGPAFLALLFVLAVPAAGAPASTISATHNAAPAPRANPRPLPPLDPYSYTWPLKPFHRQHPVRAFFGDPRIGNHGLAHNFHFGIDIHGDNRELVYATIDGTVLVPRNHLDSVLVLSDDGRTRFEYWHVRPHVRSGQRVHRNRTVVGHISCWQHVHFSEWRDGRYVNPLRPGGIGPYRDQTRPFVQSLQIRQHGHGVAATSMSGTVDLTVEAYDPAPTALPEPYTGNPVSPVLLRWRVRGNGAVTAWKTVADFRSGIPRNDAFYSVYAPSTRQNWQEHEGRYRFVVARGFDTSELGGGRHVIEVMATDTKGNTGTARFPVDVVNY
jgi:hypothetical protein